LNAPFITRVLYSYQNRAATFLYERDAAFLVAPLGAGKGAAALTALADLIRDGERRHALVIAPKLVATTVWPQEVALWPHLAHLRVAVLNGTPERRRELLAAAPAREVTAIGVDLVPWLVGELAGLADDHPLFDVLIVDETSRLKDPSGKRARALLKVAGRFRTRWGLTGTPRPNSSMDLFMPAAIVTNGALWGRAFVPWQKQHFRPRNPFGREWAALPGAEAKIAASFGTVAMTVADEDMPDLPPLNIVETPLQLPDAVMASYRAMARELLTTAEGRMIEAASPLIATGKLAQMANGFLYDAGNDDAVFVHDLKIEWLRELVESLDGEPLLIAYEFIEDLRTIRRALGEVPVLGGPTSAAESARLVAAWNAGSLPLLAFHPAAAGHGIWRLAHGVAVAELVGRAHPTSNRTHLPARADAACDHSRLHRNAHRRRDEARPERFGGIWSKSDAKAHRLSPGHAEKRLPAAVDRLQAVDREGLAEADRR